MQPSYAIGKAEPTSLAVERFGTGRISDEEIVALIRKDFDLRPTAIIHRLDLRRRNFKQTVAVRRFGRDDPDAPWERLDKMNAIKADLGE